METSKTEIEIHEQSNEVLNNFLVAVRNDDKERIKKSEDALSEHIINKVRKGIKTLYENDIDLLKNKMNEMTICGRLAMYLRDEFKDFKGYYIDTEYYRLKVPRKEVADLRKDRIRCDILLHSRGHSNSRVDNLLAIEAKLEGSTDDGSKDVKRLAEFVLPETEETPKGAIHSTLVGLFLRFGEKVCTAARVTPIEINVEG